MRRSYDVSEAALLYIEAPAETCEACSSPLWICEHRERFVHRLDGVYEVVRQLKWCHVEGCEDYHRVHTPPVDLRMALPRATYGTDVLIEVGARHLDEGRSLRGIGRDLNERGVPVSQRHAGSLLRKYVALTKAARGDDERVRQRLLQQGGILLMADGVQFDNTSPVLYMVWDALSGEPLFGERKAFRSAEDLVPLLERVQAMNVPIIGVVSDKEKGLVPAIAKVFPGVPHQLCQTHFLKNCALGLADDLKALGESVTTRADKVQQIAKRLHERGCDSVEADRGLTAGSEEQTVLRPANTAAESEAANPTPNTLGAETTSVTSDAPLSEEQLAVELCAMSRHAARSTGRAPLNPPEHVRHEGLEQVRAAVQEAQKKGATGHCSNSSIRR